MNYGPRFLSMTLLLLGAGATLSAATPTVSTVSPASGVASTSVTVIITGTNFNTAAVSAVTVNGVAVTAFTIDSDTQITASFTAPASAGKYTIVATNATGPSTTGTNLFTSKQSSTATVQVNITATVAQTLGICWTANTTDSAGTGQLADGTTAAVTWALGNITLGQIKNTINADAVNGTARDFELRNVGNAPEIFTLTTATSTGSGNNWTAAASAATSVYYLAATNGANPAQPATWNSLHGAGYSFGGASIAIDATKAFELKFQAPTALTAGADYGNQQTITVTATATAGP